MQDERNKFSAVFKAKVALAAVKGDSPAGPQQYDALMRSAKCLSLVP